MSTQSSKIPRPKPWRRIEPCPICGKEPKIVVEQSWCVPDSCKIYCKPHWWSSGYHHKVEVDRFITGFGGKSAMELAIEKWNADAEKIKKCIKVMRSFSPYEQGGTIYLPADREYTKKQLQSILRSGKDIEFI